MTSVMWIKKHSILFNYHQRNPGGEHCVKTGAGTTLYYESMKEAREKQVLPQDYTHLHVSSKGSSGTTKDALLSVYYR